MKTMKTEDICQDRQRRLRPSCGYLLCLLFATIAGISGCATRSVTQSNALPASVLDALAKANLPSDSLSVWVKRVDADAPRLAVHSERASAPASVMKLATTLAALELLGPQWQPRVELRAQQAPVMGVITGGVLLKGNGHSDFDFAALETMLSRVRAQGVTRIEGGLRVDRSAFRPERSDLGLPPFDESPEFRYNVVPDAMMLNANMLGVLVQGSATQIDTSLLQPLPQVRIVNALDLRDGPCDDWEDTWKIPETRMDAQGTISVTLRGSFPRNCTQTLQLNVLDRDEFIQRGFRLIWERLGGVFSGDLASKNAVLAPQVFTHVLGEHTARPISELVRGVNKSSDNPLARSMYFQLGIGKEQAGETTSAAAQRRMREWLRSRNVNDAQFVFDNGSGLSRSERIPANELAALLHYALTSPWSPEFVASLPIVGVDGTMRNRMHDSPAKGNARVKTGTLRDVSSLAGYVSNARGERYIVIAFVNHERANPRAARPVVEAVLDWAARLPD